MSLQKTAYLLIILISTVTILIYGQSILVPFILGILLWFIGRGTKAALNRISFIKNQFPEWLKQLLSVGIILTILFIIIEILSTNINLLAHSIEKYQPNINTIIGQVNEIFNINIQDSLQNYSGNTGFSGILKSVLSSVSDILSNSFMILLYAIFVLLEEASFRPKLQAVFVEQGQSQRIDELLEKIGNSISSYFRLKTLVSIITGVLSYIALYLIGIDAPEFWAFLIFVLNFIPTIGSLVGTVFPAVFSLFQFGEFSPAILVLLIVGTIQVLVGNFLEPRLMGSSMNISPLVTILSLSIWGAIWGITGMILSVPIAVVAIIIFSQFEKTRSLAIMLSEKGNISK